MNKKKSEEIEAKKSRADLSNINPNMSPSIARVEQKIKNDVNNEELLNLHAVQSMFQESA